MALYLQPARSTPATQTAASVYQPVSVSVSTAPGGGVTTAITPSLSAYTLAYDPTTPFANVQAMVAVTNVDLAQELVDQISASAAYKASLDVFRTAEETVNTLLNVTA